MAVAGDILPPRYLSPRLVGRGGMGEVYLATDELLAREVAVKVLSDRYGRDPELRTRFTREALTAARLTGEPSVVTIYDVGEHAHRPYIVMEHLPGGSLADELRTGPAAPGRALEWLEQAARALDAAHERGVVHRDVKPANLLLGADEKVHVTDFGIASAAGMDTLTAAGTILGTAGYLSPEQAQGRQASPASDRYALAVVAFELLAGTRPFAATSPTAEAAAHARSPVPQISSFDPKLPAELDAVFERALAKDPAARYASCFELVAALRSAFEGASAQTARLDSALPAKGRISPWPVALGLGLAAAGVGAALALARLDGPEVSVETVVRTVTVRGAPRVQTVTAPATTTGSGGATLNDEGYARMQAGDYAGALPLLEQAISDLQGSGSLVEAYASYNLAFTRLALARCDGVLELLGRSEELQGERKEIDHLRRRVEKACGD